MNNITGCRRKLDEKDMDFFRFVEKSITVFAEENWHKASYGEHGVLSWGKLGEHYT